MARGLLGMGARSRKRVGNIFDQLAVSERQRNQTNEALERREDRSRMSAAATGAGIGFQMGGPVGAMIGGAAGLLGAEIF